MIPDWGSLRIFVRPGNTDMRKQIDGLAVLVRDSLGCDLFDGSLYLFAGMGGRRLKILYWDRNGFWAIPSEVALAEAAGKGPLPLAQGSRLGPHNHHRAVGVAVGRHRLLASSPQAGVSKPVESGRGEFTLKFPSARILL
jgi:hypothetical protein